MRRRSRDSGAGISVRRELISDAADRRPFFARLHAARAPSQDEFHARPRLLVRFLRLIPVIRVLIATLRVSKCHL
jgi:hypothetical protein